MKVEDVRKFMNEIKRETANIAPNQALNRKQIIIDSALKNFPELTREVAEKIFMNEL